MTVIKCDRCGKEIGEVETTCSITISIGTFNYDICDDCNHDFFTWINRYNKMEGADEYK